MDKRRSAVYLIIALSAIMYIVCLLVPNWNDVEQLFFWNTPVRIYVFIAVPLSIYFIGLRQKRKHKHEDS